MTEASSSQPRLITPTRLRIAISMGDPGGIGPEVVVKALARPSVRDLASFRIYGLDSCLCAAAARAGLTPFWKVVNRYDETSWPRDEVSVVSWPEALGEQHALAATRRGGQLSFEFVQEAISHAALGTDHSAGVEAVVTAPICKESWSLAGFGKYPGHTELFAERFHADRAAMLFHVPAIDNHAVLNVILATVHVPLLSLARELTQQRIIDAIELGAAACRRLGVAAPRIAVCGLNPHAGEHGLLGTEEGTLIEPAIRACVSRGLTVTGPHPGDTIFNAAFAGRFDLVVAMYHDQGLIPVKLIARDRAVNVTVGLPIVRTSPDHGTAFDISGKNVADPGSMAAAIELAVRLCGA